ncbi:DsrE family protein, partial [Halomonas sp.]|uniref:DsrE family protein n=1 Tax=Halomonas sp. TaxID=1486246 RepID=UPI0035631208
MPQVQPRDLLVILRRGPHGSSRLREGLDTALVAAAFGRTVTLLFMGEGVTALVAGQKAGPLGQKGTAATLEMLEMYDIDRLLVEAS